MSEILDLLSDGLWLSWSVCPVLGWLANLLFRICLPLFPALAWLFGCMFVCIVGWSIPLPDPLDSLVSFFINQIFCRKCCADKILTTPPGTVPGAMCADITVTTASMHKVLYNWPDNCQGGQRGMQDTACCMQHIRQDTRLPPLPSTASLTKPE